VCEKIEHEEGKFLGFRVWKEECEDLIAYET